MSLPVGVMFTISCSVEAIEASASKSTELVIVKLNRPLHLPAIDVIFIESVSFTPNVYENSVLFL